jgi:hypothetical protein
MSAIPASSRTDESDVAPIGSVVERPLVDGPMPAGTATCRAGAANLRAAPFIRGAR